MTTYPVPNGGNNNTPSETGNAGPLGNSGGTAIPGDINGDGIPDFNFDFGNTTAGAEPQTVNDILAQLQSAGYPITPELRALAQKAINEKWSDFKFGHELARTTTVQQRSTMGYLSYLQELGITPQAGTDALLQQASIQGWSTDEFLYRLRKTPEYMARFPGIFDQNGQMRMSESQYLATEQQFKNIATNYGYNINSNEIGHAIANGSTPEVVNQKFEIRRRAQDYAPAMKQFGQVLKARGLSQTANLTDKQVREFIGGIGPKQWYKVYEETSARDAATMAGVKIGGDVNQYLNLSRKDVLNTINRLPGQQTEEQLTQGFQDLADQLMTTLPQSKIRGLGVSKDALNQLVFGGPKQAQVAQRVRQILQNAKAAQENQASTQFGGSQQGNYVIGGTDQRAQTGE